MAFTFTALLCLGLTLGLGTPVMAVTFLCEGTTGAKEYLLYKNGYQYLKHTKIPRNPKDKAKFSIWKIERKHAGRYRCQYQTHDGWSEFSDSLELVVTGLYSKPSLSAQPSPVVTEGGNVTLQCVSSESYHWFTLTKEGPQKLSWTLESQYNYSTRQFQALFSVGPVTSSQRWTFRCYSFNKNSPHVWSEASDPLELLVSGTLHKPTIKAEPGSVVTHTSAVTIWCQGTLDAEICVLHKEGSQKPWGTQTPENPGNKAKFSIPSVTRQHAGQYRCYCYSSAGWSERSDTLDILITGQFPAIPLLSVKPNSTIHSGDNVTLLCWSPFKMDAFILSKEGADHQPQRLKAKFRIWEFQAEFSMSAVTSDLSGTYRCYGSQDSSPYLLTHASDPVELTVSGTTGVSSLSPSKPMLTDASKNQHHTVENLIRMGLAVMILIVLGILVFEAWGSQRQTNHATEK